ncbi:hypothetical protein SNEBB_001555 [Seison nebaliae]|nr:hypothetical protein SNEBB_001555 [Seison nebaliae]
MYLYHLCFLWTLLVWHVSAENDEVIGKEQLGRSDSSKNSEHLKFLKELVKVQMKDESLHPNYLSVIFHLNVTTNHKSYVYPLEEVGFYGSDSLHSNVSSLPLFHVTSNRTDTDACGVNVDKKNRNWIALIPRGNCSFEEKIRQVKSANAVAAVIYDQDNNFQHNIRTTKHGDIVTVFINQTYGQLLKKIVKTTNTIGYLSIIKGTSYYIRITQPNKTNTVYVVILFFIFLIMTILIWCCVYYWQRMRTSNAKSRFTKKIVAATKKALSKIPERIVKDGDVVLTGDPCTICLDSFRVNDVIRELPCKHYFHKKEVDKWLMDHRSCPLCKKDILEAYDLQIKFDKHIVQRNLIRFRATNFRNDFSSTQPRTNDVERNANSVASTIS